MKGTSLFGKSQSVSIIFNFKCVLEKICKNNLGVDLSVEMYAGMTCLELLGFRVKTNGKTFHARALSHSC